MNILSQILIALLFATAFIVPIVHFYRKRYKLLRQYDIVIQKTKELNEHTLNATEERLDPIIDYIIQSNLIMNILCPNPDISFDRVEFSSYTMQEIIDDLNNENSFLCSLARCSNATVQLIIEHSKSLSELYKIKHPRKYKLYQRQNDKTRDELDKLISELSSKECKKKKTNTDRIEKVTNQVVENVEVKPNPKLCPAGAIA